MRSIIFKVFRKKSPFDGLVEHAEKISVGVQKLKEAIGAYLEKDFSSFERLSEEVIKIENEADRIKGNIRNHLPKGIFMPVDKGDFLSCLKEQDSILDACQDIVVWLQFRKTEVEIDFREEIEEYLFKVINIVDELVALIKDVHRLISSLSLKERKRIKGKIRNIHFEEEEIDRMERNLIKNIFSSGKDMLHIYHLIHVVFLLGSIADHAENMGDRIRVMMAK